VAIPASSNTNIGPFGSTYMHDLTLTTDIVLLMRAPSKKLSWC